MAASRSGLPREDDVTPTLREMRHARARANHELKMAQRRGRPTTHLENDVKRLTDMIAKTLKERA